MIYHLLIYAVYYCTGIILLFTRQSMTGVIKNVDTSFLKNVYIIAPTIVSQIKLGGALRPKLIT